MTDKEHLEKADLLSGYLDEQLSPRQMTEFKRMLNKDPQMQQELEQLKRQQSILRKLPIESAPAGLAEDIKSTLERRFILDRSARHHAPNGQFRLWIRRIAAVAALVLLPLFALGLVVYTIIQPTTLETGELRTQASLADDNAIQNAQPDFASQYTPVLQFQTAQPIAIADFIEKKIHTLGLMNVTAGQRESDRASFKITCSRQYIAGLIDQMSQLWPRCEKTTYTLLSKDSPAPVARIAQVDAAQAIEMLQSKDIADAVRLASTLTEQNNDNPLDQNSFDAPLSPLDTPLRPILAWDENDPNRAPITQDTISLVIEVLGL